MANTSTSTSTSTSTTGSISTSTSTNASSHRPVPTTAGSSSSLEIHPSVMIDTNRARDVTTDATRRMLCGGMAGMIAKSVTNPLERVKILSQTGEHSGAYNVLQIKQSGKGSGVGIGGGPFNSRTTILGLYRDIVKNEGIVGLWAGNGVNMLRVFPAKAVIFSSNDAYRHIFTQLASSSTTQEIEIAWSGSINFIAGGCAGMTASAVTYPLDLTRGRISGKLGIGGEKVYGGILQTMAVTVKDEGFAALYKGITPTIMGAMPYEGIKFGTVGLLEKMFPRENQGGKPDPLRKMLFGGIGGIMAGFVTYPNDTVRRLLQLQGSRGTTTVYHGYWDCVRQTYREHGIVRFYRGLTINIIRMAPNAAVQFGSYELLKMWTATL